MTSKNEKSNTFSRVVSCILNFDATGLLDILDHSFTYQDMLLVDFSIQVGNRLQSFREKGDTALKMSFSLCEMCHSKSPVVVFTGNRSRTTYALYFEYKNDAVTDIYECNSYGDIVVDDPF